MAPKSRKEVNDSESSGDEAIENLDYKPPKDFSLYKGKKSVFDTAKAAKQELWLIRVPEGVTNDDLASMSIHLPAATSGSQEPLNSTFTLGTLKKKETSTTSSTTTKYHLQTVTPDSGIAGEMLTLQAIIPDSSKGGRFVQAPLGFHHHLALVAQPTIPSGSPLAEEILSRPIPQKKQPEGLKMRFKFAGSDTLEPGSKPSKSGKEFAARWAKTLEKRRQEEEEELLRAQQAEEAAEEEEGEEGEEEKEDGEGTSAIEVEAEGEEASDNGDSHVTPVDEAAQDDAEEEELPSRKRKSEHMDIDATGETSRKEKKEKKEKKAKKEKKEKKEKKRE
ncbi:MAG: hypothetical protein J3Q66DRAFT_391218 [Benniella sp.]|nr:MAG: hypothetical protein J3Q66DRAFT_391218 [Benniella sp.]